VASINSEAFRNCAGLTELIIPATVKSIGYMAFEGCDSLKIYAEATSEPQNWGYGWNNSFNGTIYYYSETEKTGCWHYVSNVPTAW
jgi:hypothetical protein